MSSIVRNVRKKYGKNNHYTILTRPENSIAMKEIEGVKTVLQCSLIQFDHKNIDAIERANLSSYRFDLIIIPISGNVHSYSNVLKFAKRIFGTDNVIYHKGDGEFGKRPTSVFYSYTPTILFSTFRFVANAISLIMTIPLMIIFAMNILFSFNYREDQS
tara:strand:+ start:2020 stop:2496 length:477 start_codon:yes stop_codon:yes gene_type:complete